MLPLIGHKVINAKTLVPPPDTSNISKAKVPPISSQSINLLRLGRVKGRRHTVRFVWPSFTWTTVAGQPWTANREIKEQVKQ